MKIALSFKELDNIDQRDRDVVNGYIREWVHSNNAIVPDLVIYTILSFYYFVLFGDCSADLKLCGKNHNTLTKNNNQSSYMSSAYASSWIPSNTGAVIKWKIINHKGGHDNLLIGLINKNHHHNINKDIEAIYIAMVDHYIKMVPV